MNGYSGVPKDCVGKRVLFGLLEVTRVSGICMKGDRMRYLSDRLIRLELPVDGSDVSRLACESVSSLGTTGSEDHTNTRLACRESDKARHFGRTSEVMRCTCMPLAVGCSGFGEALRDLPFGGHRISGAVKSHTLNDVINRGAMDLIPPSAHKPHNGQNLQLRKRSMEKSVFPPYRTHHLCACTITSIKPISAVPLERQLSTISPIPCKLHGQRCNQTDWVCLFVRATAYGHLAKPGNHR